MTGRTSNEIKFIIPTQGHATLASVLIEELTSSSLDLPIRWFSSNFRRSSRSNRAGSCSLLSKVRAERFSRTLYILFNTIESLSTKVFIHTLYLVQCCWKLERKGFHTLFQRTGYDHDTVQSMEIRKKNSDMKELI